MIRCCSLLPSRTKFFSDQKIRSSSSSYENFMQVGIQSVFSVIYSFDLFFKSAIVRRARDAHASRFHKHLTKIFQFIFISLCV